MIYQSPYFIARKDATHDNKENHISNNQSKVYLIVHQASMRKHIYFNLRIPSRSPLPILPHTRGTKMPSSVVVTIVVIAVEFLYFCSFLFQTV